MGFFKWLDNHIRESNENWHKDYRAEQERQRAEQEAEQRYLDSIECCANCYWFKRWDGARHYRCCKRDFCFDFDEADRGKIHYKRTCKFFKKI